MTGSYLLRKARQNRIRAIDCIANSICSRGVYRKRKAILFLHASNRLRDEDALFRTYDAFACGA